MLKTVMLRSGSQMPMRMPTRRDFRYISKSFLLHFIQPEPSAQVEVSAYPRLFFRWAEIGVCRPDKSGQDQQGAEGRSGHGDGKQHPQKIDGDKLRAQEHQKAEDKGKGGKNNRLPG